MRAPETITVKREGARTICQASDASKGEDTVGADESIVERFYLINVERSAFRRTRTSVFDFGPMAYQSCNLLLKTNTIWGVPGEPLGTTPLE